MSLTLKNISLNVAGQTHIHPTDLTLPEGGITVLLGTTLAGKTSLMRLMAGLEKPSSGEVWFNGQNVTGVAVQKRDIAMVYQQFINYPNFTVYENIASPLHLRRLSQGEIRDAVERVADLLQLTPMLQRMPGELSGGQQQRTALARALVKQARLVLLDEPLANLDYKLREELREELPKLFRNTGATLVYATTEPTEALLLGGHTATLHEGRVTQFGPSDEVYRRPDTTRTARVYSDPPMNIVTISKRAGHIHLNSTSAWPTTGAAAALPDGEYTLGIRPHHVTLAPTSARSVAVTGEVLLTELTGSDSTVHATIDGTPWISQSQGVHSLQPGSPVQLHLNPDHCLLFDADEQRLVP